MVCLQVLFYRHRNFSIQNSDENQGRAPSKATEKIVSNIWLAWILRVGGCVDSAWILKFTSDDLCHNKGGALESVMVCNERRVIV